MEKVNSKSGDNMALDVYSGGLAIEPLRESMGKLSYGEKIFSRVEFLLPTTSFQQ